MSNDQVVRCAHGFAPGENSPPSGWYAAPFDECGCCNSLFMYIDNSSGSSTGSRTTAHTPGLCEGCGGRYVTTYTGRGSYDQKSGDGPWEHFEWWTDDAGVVHTKTTPGKSPR